MSKRIISNFDEFSDQFKKISKDKKNPRIRYLKKYFERGGVISLGNIVGAWPKLIYPSATKIELEIDAVNKIKEKYSGELKNWDNHFNKAKISDKKNHVMKFANPLYWKHKVKSAIDSDYKQDSDKVKLPVHLVVEPRWKPMINMFLHDIEYRKQLAETVENSVVYKKDRRVARYADQLKNFRMSVSSKKSESLKEKIKEIDETIAMFQEILAWAKE